MRIRKKPWSAKELAENPRILKDPAKYREYFDNDHPIHVEIGCGKGRFITQTAAKNPNINYIAIEREATVLAVAARLSRVVDEGDSLTGSTALTDSTALTGSTSTTGRLAFMELDATELPKYFKPGEIKRLYINFCDPWHRRKKWAKRRLTHANFLEMYEALDIPEIFFKTDNRILFEFSINQFSERGWIMRNISLDLHKDLHEDSIKDSNKDSHKAGFDENVMTEYEEKFSAKGPIYRLEAYR